MSEDDLACGEEVNAVLISHFFGVLFLEVLVDFLKFRFSDNGFKLVLV